MGGGDSDRYIMRETTQPISIKFCPESGFTNFIPVCLGTIHTSREAQIEAHVTSSSFYFRQVQKSTVSCWFLSKPVPYANAMYIYGVFNDAVGGSDVAERC